MWLIGVSCVDGSTAGGIRGMTATSCCPLGSRYWEPTTLAICFVFTVSGAALVLNFFSGWAPKLIVDTIASFSFLTHFTGIMRGVIDLRDIIYFASLIVAFLFATAIVVDMKKASSA